MAFKRQVGKRTLATKVAAATGRSRYRTSAKKAPVVSVVEKGVVRIETPSGPLLLKADDLRDLVKRLETPSGAFTLKADSLRDLHGTSTMKRQKRPTFSTTTTPAMQKRQQAPPPATSKRIRIEVLAVRGPRLVKVKVIESPPLGGVQGMRSFERATAKVLKQYGDSRRFKIIQMEA